MASRSPVDGSRARFALNPATVIIICALGLTILGLTILFSASASFKQGPYFYLSKQLAGVAGAAALCWVTSRINLDYLRQYVWWIAGVMVVLLVLVRVPHIGISVKGSWRWLGVGPARVQVSEFAKFALVFCLAHYLALNQTRIGELKRGYLYPLALIGGFAGLIMLEPDFGTSALTLFVGLALVYLAGAKWRYVVPTVAVAAGLFGVAVMHNPNRLRRMTEFLSDDKSYQLRQAVAAYAAGGVDGAGLGQGRQQLSFLPEAHTDFIFSIIGEELGLWFTLGVVALFLVIFVAGLVHLRRAPNLFQYLLVAGSLLLICVQAIINIGVVTGVLPTKGMSLPFISAGLSNLLLMGLLLGVFLNTQRTWSRATLPGRGRAMEEVLA
ncbi:MAG TPA: putative peptidoglycan glycosyltransferase FtsW [Opitutus sp.]|nr:putative peptidoglycan glycosyltransferase FtsW [Opitutus sp.]